MAPRDGLRVLGNRGASGIDGLLSTALGVAVSGTGPTFALLGDLSFLYDAGALLWNARRGTDLVVVVNDNAGGQIFAGLGQRELQADELERLFVTPSDVDLEQLCVAAGAGHIRVDRSSKLVPALDVAAAAGGLRVVQVSIDADRDRARRAELREAVDAALAR
jgi:2-succinyl-5-enolpyruvyl-6-hydroxy-3-cyclohexene-1-carboxylate synthase